MISRRNFLEGIIAAAVAPAFVRTAGLLMPIKPLIVIPEATIGGEVSGWAVNAVTYDCVIPPDLMRTYLSGRGRIEEVWKLDAKGLAFAVRPVGGDIHERAGSRPTDSAE